MVEQSGVQIRDSHLYDSVKLCTTEGDVLKAIGKHIMVKQGVEGGDAQPLSSEEKTLLQNLEIVMKAARKLNDNTPTKFECFNQFERTNRYEYEGDKYKGVRTTSKSGTAWTSYFKDALAFDSIKFGGSSMSVANAMTSVGNGPSKTLSDTAHVELLNHFSKEHAKHGVPAITVKDSDIQQLKTKQADELKAIGGSTRGPTSLSRPSSTSIPSKIPGAPMTPEDLTTDLRSRSDSLDGASFRPAPPPPPIDFNQQQWIHVDSEAGRQTFNVTIEYPYQEAPSSSRGEEGKAVVVEASQDQLKQFSDAIAGKTIKDGVVEVIGAGDLSGFYRLDSYGRVIAKGNSEDDLSQMTSKIINAGDVSQVLCAKSDQDCSGKTFKDVIEKIQALMVKPHCT